MILLFNVFLTNSSGNQFVKFDRGNLDTSSKLDITKYCLSSLSVLNFSKVILNIELDLNIYDKNDYLELKNFVNKEFIGCEIIFNEKRNSNQSDWIDTYEKIGDKKLIFLLCNHDHVFINSNNFWYNYIKCLDYDPTLTIFNSHWLESIRSAQSGYIELNELKPRKLNKGYSIKKNYVEYESISLDSINIITSDIYKNWFFEGNWGNFSLPRVDGIGKGNLFDIKNYLGLTLIPQKIIVPYKEQFRHFDGYMHQRISNQVCPALSIPTGFFKNEIKIRYGYEDYKEGWVNFNPKKEYYRAYNLNGTDDKITIEDFPLFWKNKIVEIDVNKNINEEEMIQHRLKAVLDMLHYDDRYFKYVDKEIENNILTEYLKSYKNYELQ